MWRAFAMTAAIVAGGVAVEEGRIAPGQVADLVVLARDPASDVTAFSDVQYTIRGGRLIYRAR
jgi:imidazolonepropionase-like amidohydrolase